MPPEQAQKHFQHISGCGICGALFRQAVSDLNEEITVTETKQVAGLESATPEWQHRLARRIAGTIPADAKSVPWWSRWRIPQLALVAAGLVAAAILAQTLQFELAHKLVVRAYSDQRTFAPRMAGAAYAPVDLKRGNGDSLLDRPVKLLLAEALIAFRPGSHADDPSWLHTKAQADLLDGKYDAAEQSLRRALQISPKSPDILTDLATANFQKGNYAEAFESLSQVLAIRPNDPVALFNRALVAERQLLYRQALDDWDHYLKVDPGSKWAQEAREAAERVRNQVVDHDRGRAAPLLTPAQLANSPAGSNQLEVNQRVEEYLDEAVRSWLPSAYPETRASADLAARQALFFLADLTSQQHGDRWLSDLLHGTASPAFPRAVAALARALRANEAGEYDVATEQSVRAYHLFRASGNVAGSLRAQFEQTFAAQLKRDSDVCRRQAVAALAESERYLYSWLQIQLGLEKGVCSFLMGDIGADEIAGRKALDLAQENGYGNLYLRALSFTAEDKLATGDQRDASRLVSAGLVRYWLGEFTPLRGYNLYHILGRAAEAADQPNLQVAIWREAVALIDSDEDLLLRAWAHNYMASAATAAHQPQIAERQFAEASRLFALAPRSQASRSYALETEIRIARLQARQRRFDAALVRLTSIQDQLRTLQNNYLIQMFYSTLGELQLAIHREVEGEQALRPALALAEQNLESLRSEAERISWSKEAAPVYLALAQAELAQGRSQQALEMYEWYLGASQRVGTSPHPHRPIANPPVPVPLGLAPRLPLLSQETVLAYGLLPGGLAIWIYDDRGVSAHWIPKATQDLQELAARFSDLSSDPKSELSALRRDARSLYEALIAPVEWRLAPGRTLVIEAEGPLARVPFEALLDSNGHYLIERWSIVHSLGQDSDARLHNLGPISADLPALVVGSTASSTADGLIPLPDVAAEADTVASGFHAANVLKGRDASLNAVRSELPAAAVFHFAGHSLSTPDKAGLMLVDEDARTGTPILLDADLLRRLKLPSMQLAVLSACSTASGSGGSGGFNSVTEALLRAGVPHVVASRWAVDSVEARAFVEDFYRNALSGQSVSDAIRLTSRKMLSNVRTAHPYYWSAFAAYGRP
jgi:CHAT domain-containing protein